MVVIFAQFLKVASGDIEELEDYIPDIIMQYIIDKDSLTRLNGVMKDKYSDNYDIKSPYYLEHFSRQIFSISVLSTASIFICYVGYKLFHKITRFKINFDEFFFNAPLRTMTELYLDTMLICFINTGVFGLSNIYRIIANFIFLTILLLASVFPFILLSITQKCYN